MALNRYQQQWVDELRHGGHRQGRGALALAIYDTSDGWFGWKYCCLGVAACKVFGASEEEFGSFGVMSEAEEFDGVANKLGLRMMDQDELANLNDLGLSFDEIADVIEQMVANDEAPMTVARRLGYAGGA